MHNQGGSGVWPMKRMSGFPSLAFSLKNKDIDFSIKSEHLSTTLLRGS